MKIIGLGNALVDILIELPGDQFLKEHGLPKGGMQLIDEKQSQVLLAAAACYPNTLASGRSASNTMHGLANLGVSSAYIGKTGNDEHGAFFEADMYAAGIKAYLPHSTQRTGTALTFITPDGERTFGTYLGAAVDLSPDDLQEEHFSGYDLLHLEGYLCFNTALAEHALSLARRCGLKTSLDLASYTVVEANYPFMQKMVKEYVDILFANEEEAKAFTGKPPREALDQIAEQCNIAVVKMGPDGSWVSMDNKVVRVNAAEATPKDTTGAGDLYAAGFLFGLSNGMTPAECANNGSLVAYKVIEVLGAKLDPITWNNLRTEIIQPR